MFDQLFGQRSRRRHVCGLQGRSTILKRELPSDQPCRPRRGGDKREDQSDNVVAVLNAEASAGAPKDVVNPSTLAVSAAVIFAIEGVVGNAARKPRLRKLHGGCKRTDRRWNQDCLHAGKFACAALTGANGGLIAGSRLYCSSGKGITGPRVNVDRGKINEIMAFCRQRGYAMAAGASYSRTELAATCVPGLHFSSQRYCEDLEGGGGCKTHYFERTFSTFLGKSRPRIDDNALCRERFGDRMVPAGGSGYGCALPIARFDIAF
ncbi:MAG: hypothetical protein AAF318_18590 [Pseudomonadota bacterium]